MADSPVVGFLRSVWKNGQKGTGHSWLRFNQAMKAALILTVEAGFEWRAGDLATCFKDFNAGYWIGANGFEDLYRRAVAYRNASAWQSLEQHANRKPFIIAGAKLPHNYGGGRMGGGLSRIVEGAEFVWNGERVVAGAFNDEKGYFSATSWTREKPKGCGVCKHIIEWPSARMKSRYKITHADIKAAKKAVLHG